MKHKKKTTPCCNENNYTASITPVIQPCRQPVFATFDETNPSIVKTFEQLPEFVLNSGGVTIFGSCDREKMSMINELNKINWGHGDGTTCILLPPTASLRSFVVYRSWLLQNSANFNRVDPVFIVYNANSICGTIGINGNGKLVDYTVKFDVSTLTNVSGIRIEPRDIFHRGTFAELHIIAVFSNTTDYTEQLEKLIQSHQQIPRPESVSSVVKDSTIISNKRGVVNPILDATVVASTSASQISGSHLMVTRRNKVSRQTDTNPYRFRGNYCICLGDFLKIVDDVSLSHSAFVISDPRLLGDHVTGVHNLLAQCYNYFQATVQNDDTVSMNPSNIWHQIETATAKKVALPLNKWSFESTAEDNNALLAFSHDHPTVLKLVLRRILYGDSFSNDENTVKFSPLDLRLIPLNDQCIVSQIMVAACAIIQKKQ